MKTKLTRDLRAAGTLEEQEDLLRQIAIGGNGDFPELADRARGRRHYCMGLLCADTTPDQQLSAIKAMEDTHPNHVRDALDVLGELRVPYITDISDDGCRRTQRVEFPYAGPLSEKLAYIRETRVAGSDTFITDIGQSSAHFYLSGAVRALQGKLNSRYTEESEHSDDQARTRTALA